MSADQPRGVTIAGNWKMNFGPRETEAFFRDLSKDAGTKLGPQGLKRMKQGTLRAVLIPPSVSLETARREAARAPIPVAIAAQNAHWERQGAFTGEISGPMLAELGIGWALVGHSERRQYFGETDETTRRRAESLLGQGFHVILCIGETRAEREAGKTAEVLARQVAGACPARPDDKLTLAYEPVWAIGTGLTATPEQAEEAQARIRSLLKDRFGADSAARMPILYGGSVTPANIAGLLACPNIDGALVGGASLKPEGFLEMLSAGGRALEA